MKGLISLAVVVAFFVTIPQCLGQDADQSPGQLLTEQQLVQMFQLAMLQGPGQSGRKARESRLILLETAPATFIGNRQTEAVRRSYC